MDALSCAISFKSSFTFSPVQAPCGYTWEESEQGVPGRSFHRYASWLQIHLDQRHRGRAFTQPFSAIFLWPFPWKPHTVAAAQTPQNRGSYFFLFVPHLGGVSAWGSRASSNERMRAVSMKGQMEMLNGQKNKCPQGNGARKGDQGAYARINRIPKTTKILISKSLSDWRLQTDTPLTSSG